jgi:prolyl 4-hydroxylase
MVPVPRDQYYSTHHDLIHHHINRQQGFRIFTLYFYLSNVEEGGGTHFPQMNITVTPKKGRAVLWPSVHDHDPNLKDERTEHGALPVIKGVKYGANAWIHQRDFKGPNLVGCD